MKYEDKPQFWFKAKPKSQDSKPDANFLRDLGDLNGEPVCEIWYKSEKWICKKSELKTTAQALAAVARDYANWIAEKNEPGMSKAALAKKLSITPKKLKEWEGFIVKYLST